jgi:CAAX protease family protein
MSSLSRLSRSSLIAYSLLGVISVAVIVVRDSPDAVFAPPQWPRTAANVGAGVVLAVLVLGGSAMLRSGFAWARRLEDEFRGLLGPLTTADAWILAGASGFVEELFFRATLQPALGLWLTSALFGLLHYPANRRMIPWTVMATILGLVFGVVYDRTDSLLVVALGHGLVNLVELLRISRAGFRTAS